MSDFRDWIKLRNETKNEDGKLCYCGHTDRCDCGDPSSEMFENALEGDFIILGDPKNGWKNVLEPKHGGDEEILVTRKDLRLLVDKVWNDVTESTEVPSTIHADDLINSVLRDEQ